MRYCPLRRGRVSPFQLSCTRFLASMPSIAAWTVGMVLRQFGPSIIARATSLGHTEPPGNRAARSARTSSHTLSSTLASTTRRASFGHRVWFRWRLPSRRRCHALLVRAESHRPRPLPLDTGQVRLLCLVGGRAAAQKIDPVSAAACLFEVEVGHGCLHSLLKCFDCVGHSYITHDPRIGRIQLAAPASRRISCIRNDVLRCGISKKESPNRCGNFYGLFLALKYVPPATR